MRRHSSCVTVAIAIASIWLGALSASGQCNLPRLETSDEHPNYFAEVGTGKAVYLTGSHTWTNFQGWSESNPGPSPDSTAFLAALRQNGHNFMRGWTWEQARWAPWTSGNLYFSPMPYQRSRQGGAPAGGNKFDLDKWNESYFNHLRSVIEEACRNDIYVGVMLFQGWSFKRHHSNTPGDPWPGHPFHRNNNINQVDGDPNNTGEGLLSHTLRVQSVLEAQQRYVDKMIAELGSLPNIIWEISNESHEGIDQPAVFGNSRDWQYYWINYIRNAEMGTGREHPIWMTGSLRIPNGWLNQSGADAVGYGGSNYRTHLPEAAGGKVSLLDTDHIFGLGGSYIWVWKAFTNGHNPIFMDPYFNPQHITVPAGLDAPRIRAAMGKTLEYSRRVDMASMTPNDDWCDDMDEDDGSAYCLVDPGNTYIVFQPKHSPNGNDNPIRARFTPGTYRVERYDPWNDRVQTVYSFTQSQDAWRTLAGGPGRPVYFIQKTSNPEPQTVMLEAMEDAFVIQNRPNDNVGSAVRLRVRWSDTGVGKRAFMKFAVPTTLGDVQSATLKLKTLAEPVPNVGIYRMNGLSWTESSITWNTHLPDGPSPFTHLTSADGLLPNTVYEFDVTSAFEGYVGGPLTLGMASGSLNMGMDFSSREGGFKPILEIVHMP